MRTISSPTFAPSRLSSEVDSVPYELALVDETTISADVLERVLQSLLFASDSVAIRATYRVGSQSAVERRLEELNEQGRLTLWAHEHEMHNLDRGTVLAPESERERLVSIVVPQGAFAERMRTADESISANLEQAYDRLGPGTRQGVAEVVVLRRQVGALMLASILERDGILARRSPKSLINAQFRRRDASLREEVAVDVLRRLRVGSLLNLSAAKFDELRGYTADFRRLLDRSILKAASAHPVVRPTDVADELLATYTAILEELRPEGVVKPLIAEGVWDVVGTVVPPTLPMKYGLKALALRRASDSVRPFLLLAGLQAATTDASP